VPGGDGRLDRTGGRQVVHSEYAETELRGRRPGIEGDPGESGRRHGALRSVVLLSDERPI
ncbi:hypothetical protein, partial [Pseudomonas sp. AB12(2023)]|uniref:hypothetical protein n=1 Tax=Pseudomonas sp. AB12(2023) TaxID=3048597 RepID=UPI002B223E84